MKTVEAASAESPEQRHEKGREAFKDSYDTALALRNFSRGWGTYEDKKSKPFGYTLSRLAEQAINLSSDALKEGTPFAEKYATELADTVDELKLQAALFQKDADVGTALNWLELDTLKQFLRKRDALGILTTATRMRSYFTGLENGSELVLRPADRVLERHNSLER